MLHGREHERERIRVLIDGAWALQGGSLVLRGEPGVGKSSLLLDCIDRAEGMRVLTTQGIESESPLAFSALQRLLRPVMRLVDRLAESRLPRTTCRTAHEWRDRQLHDLRKE